MKRYLLLFLVINLLFGQDKYQFFLTSDENLKLVGENYDIIKTELDKMLADYNSKIDLDNYWKVRNSERVFVRQERDLDAINNALEMDRALMAGMNIYEKKAHMDLIESYGTKNIYKDIHGEKNRVIERVETLSTKEAEWSDVVSYYGGYSELSKLGISKDDKSKFDISVFLRKIELTGPSTCLAHVHINGNDDALKFHKIPKSTYKYKGVYDIDYDKDYLTLYNGGNIWADFKFDEKKYLPKSKTEINIQLNKSLLPSTENYRSNIITMIDDLVSKSDWTKLDPNFSVLKSEYIELFGEMTFEYDLINYTKSELQNKILEKKSVQYKAQKRQEASNQKKMYRNRRMACLTGCGIVGLIIINYMYQNGYILYY